MAESLTLRVRDASDLTQQIAYHRYTALALALHRSTLVQPLRSPQNVPHASPRTQAAGSAEAARLEDLKAELETRYYRLVKARNTGSVADIQAADRRITELEGRIAKTLEELAAIDTRRSAPPGIVHLYAVEVPGLNVAGYVEAVYAPERYVLDTHWLGMVPDLRERLGRYLHSGVDAAPYWYRKDRHRYRENPNASADYRCLMADLWKHVTLAPVVQRLVKVGVSS